MIKLFLWSVKGAQCIQGDQDTRAAFMLFAGGKAHVLPQLLHSLHWPPHLPPEITPGVEFHCRWEKSMKRHLNK